MANEISLSFSLGCFKSSVMSAAIGRFVNGAQFTMTGNLYTQGLISVATSATAIPLGQVTQPHWAFFYNMDATNFVKIRNGSTGADLIKLLALESCPVPLLDTSVPYAIADTAACTLEYLIISL